MAHALRCAPIGISIHALLAESDERDHQPTPHGGDFYPRSPCGERRFALHVCVAFTQFLSTLSLRRATAVSPFSYKSLRISIHALLAESDNSARDAVSNAIFLSTLSLRRATFALPRSVRSLPYFYPRSPCGERPVVAVLRHDLALISIHALLAESDCVRLIQCYK